MSFAWPHLLWLLFVPAGLLTWEIVRRRRAHLDSSHPKILRAEVGTGSLQLAAGTGTITRSRVRPWLAVGLGLAIVALARPQWGRIEEPVFDQAREILLAVDLSRSMLAPDVKPARLDRAKLLIQALLEKLQGERVGLVVFSGTAFLQAPLSADYEILREFLPSLNPEFLPEGGTNYRALIDTALDAFGSSGAADRFLIVLSDGEATDDDWKAKVDDLKKRGVRVIGLGVGTAAGSMIPDGTGGFVKDSRGAVVLSKLEPATLQELAKSTNGTYRDASTWLDLAAVLDETVNTGKKGDFVDKNTVRLVERFQWPLALALWCLFVSLYYEFPVRPRPRTIGLAPTPPAPGPTPPRATAASATTAAAQVSLVALASAMLLGAGSNRLDAAVRLKPATGTPAVVAPFPGSPQSAAPEAKAEPPLLGKMVGRLAEAETQSARDWSELGRETVTWGTRLKSSQQPVPEGPVRDALRAVELGEKLDPKVTDWSKLREELEALLQKPEQQQQQDQKQQNSSQNKDQQQNQQQKQQNQQQPPPDQKDKSQENSDSKQAQENQPDKEPKQGEQKDQSPPPEKKEAEKPSQQSAFGDMKKESPPPPSPGETQKVGGVPEKKDENKQPTDPALAMQLEKLEQLKDKDSPAKLFQMMQADQAPPAKKKNTKDW